MTGLGISLAEWSLHRAIESGRIAPLDFPRVARESFGIEAVELVNVLMEGRGERALRELRRRADDHGVRLLLIMCDDEGDLSDPDPARRRRAVTNHHAWIDAAAALGCHAVRVNTGGDGRPVSIETVRHCVESCRELIEYAERSGVAVLLENHGGLSASVGIIEAIVGAVDHPLLGTLPDFGNPLVDADMYEGVARMMPWARAVSAKCFDFDDVTGEETTIDFSRMLRILREAGYGGFLGIEYEGDRLDELEGIRRAKALLERVIG